MAKVAVLVGTALIAFGCSGTGGQAKVGPAPAPEVGHPDVRTLARPPTCLQDGSAVARQCWQQHTGALGYATDVGRPWTQGTANPDAQDPATDPNLVTVCGTRSRPVRIDLLATSTTVTGGTCRGPSLTGTASTPTYRQLKDVLVYGCVNVMADGAVLVDDYVIDAYPSCVDGGGGANEGAAVQTGSVDHDGNFRPGKLTTAALLVYVTVDGYGCHSTAASPNLCGEAYAGIGYEEYELRNVNVFGFAHDFYADGDDGDSASPADDDTTGVTIADSMAPMAMGYTDVVAGHTECVEGDETGVHQEDLFTWSPSGVHVDHDYFSVDAGTAADPEGSTGCASGAILENASANNFRVDDTYLDGGGGFDLTGSCTDHDGADTNETLDGNSLAKVKGWTSGSYGYSGTIFQWSPTGTGDVWGTHNHSADGTVTSVGPPTPADGGC